MMKPVFNRILAATLATTGLGFAMHANAEITFYEFEHFDGRSVTIDRRADSLRADRFNDRASSAVVSGRRGDRWEVCDGAAFSGRCVVLRPGEYPSLDGMGMNDRISSARLLARNESVDEDRYVPAPVVERDFRQRNGERLFEADVVDVRAIVATPEQRHCWIERGVSDRDNRVPGAIAGAVIGGILGHQVGGGSGRDLATIGGVIGGAAVGSHLGRGDVRVQDVQRCTSLPSQTRTEFYDVTYRFRGQEHHAQLTTPPGPTILVNRDGLPRG